MYREDYSHFVKERIEEEEKEQCKSFCDIFNFRKKDDEIVFNLGEWEEDFELKITPEKMEVKERYGSGIICVPKWTKILDKNGTTFICTGNAVEKLTMAKAQGRSMYILNRQPRYIFNALVRLLGFKMACHYDSQGYITLYKFTKEASETEIVYRVSDDRFFKVIKGGAVFHVPALKSTTVLEYKDLSLYITFLGKTNYITISEYSTKVSFGGRK